MSTESLLISETEKWQKKAEAEFKKIAPANAKGEEFAKNISAYINDCVFFTRKKDHVRAFEAVIWAWAWIEIGREMKVLTDKKQIISSPSAKSPSAS